MNSILTFRVEIQSLTGGFIKMDLNVTVEIGTGF